MASWSEFAADEPRLADGIRVLIQQYGPGFGYLATVRADGGPRVHPVSPVITDEGLFCFVIDSPKRRDLERDGRYALHSFPPEESDDEAYVAGPGPAGDRPGPGGAAGAERPRPSRRSTGGSSSSPSTWRCSTRREQHIAGVPGLAPGRPAVRVWLDPNAPSAVAAPLAVPQTRPTRLSRDVQCTAA